MLSSIDNLIPWFGDMTELGGGILLLILAVATLIWGLVFERLIFLWVDFPGQANNVVRHWQAREEHHSWYAQQFRQRLLLHIKWSLQRNLGLMRVLIALCPLLGLLGTVLGMLDVFEDMAASGQNNPRSTAAGVSKATVTTMAGMVVAISGMLVSIAIERKATREQLRVTQSLSIDNHE